MIWNSPSHNLRGNDMTNMHYRNSECQYLEGNDTELHFEMFAQLNLYLLWDIILQRK